MSQIIQMDSSLQLKRKSGAGQPENNAILGVIRRGGLPLESATITGGYVETMSDLIAAGEDIASLARSQTGWQKIKPKIKSKWKVFQLSRRQMEEALPKF